MESPLYKDPKPESSLVSDLLVGLGLALLVVLIVLAATTTAPTFVYQLF